MKDAVEHRGLKEGSKGKAMVKASSVMVVTDEISRLAPPFERSRSIEPRGLFLCVAPVAGQITALNFESKAVGW
ncbi:hypothetical protein DVDV_1745 [Desulfovibrio sp. DV]|nr:hypothetical protein DVDV_1745 [Desulfovibrio sp. DV]